MMIKKVSLVALCAVALFGGKVLAEEQKQEEAAPAEQAEQAAEEKPAAPGGSFEDILESPKIKELLAQENIDWDAVMKALGEMDFNLGGEGEEEDSHSHQHSHSHHDDSSDAEAAMNDEL